MCYVCVLHLWRCDSVRKRENESFIHAECNICVPLPTKHLVSLFNVFYLINLFVGNVFSLAIVALVLTCSARYFAQA